MTSLDCPKCGIEILPGSRFCQGCGQAICSNCGAALLTGSRFCNKCGTPLASDAAPPKSQDYSATSDGEWDPYRDAQPPRYGVPPRQPPSGPPSASAEPPFMAPPFDNKTSTGDTKARRRRKSAWLWTIVPGLIGVALLTTRGGQKIGILFMLVAAVAFLITVISGNRNETVLPSEQRASGKKSIRGLVRGFQSRTESWTRALDKVSVSRTVWTWTVADFDENGNPLPQVPVEMKAKLFKGFVADGHDVEIAEAYRPGVVCRPSRVYNHSTQSWVTGRGSGGVAMTLFVVLIVLGVIMFIMTRVGGHLR
jgi:hypothetical protein